MEPDLDDRITELAGRYGLPGEARLRLRALIEILAGDIRAPTSVQDPERAIDVHLADALVALELEATRSARTIADIGSGAGFPGMPLAIAMPESQVRLVESQARKCAFLRRAASAAGIENVRTVQLRAEVWREGADDNDAVLARALASQPVVLEYAAPLLRRGGMLIDWRGRRDASEELSALRAAAELGMERVEVRHVQPFPAAEDRHLHVFVKAAETPPRFPRRPGIARKRPLGG